VLQSWYGQQLFGAATGADRGQHEMNGVAYRVAGNTLYEIDILGVHTNRGSIPGSSRCSMANDGINIFVVADGVVSQYSRVTMTTVVVTDSDIIGSTFVDFCACATYEFSV
jgi:hypothetical protein